MAHRSKTSRRLLVALAAPAVAGWLAFYGRYDWLGLRILREYDAAISSSPPQAAAVQSEEIAIQGPDGSIDARLYVAAGTDPRHGIVLVHGMSPEGLNEPRLIAFAQVLARNGFAVLTPQLASLADFRVDASAVTTIGNSAIWLQHRLESGPVAVLGLSFAGGLSLMAAAEPAFAPHIRAVISVGGYDSLSRVGRFLIMGEALTPNGRTVALKPNDYGALIYVAMHPEEFFAKAEAASAGAAMADWLHGKTQTARTGAASLSPAGRALLEDLFADRIEAIRPQLLAVLAADKAEMDALSPEGKLGDVQAPVYLLHGAGDNVIPWTEESWLEREVPKKELRRSLITSAMDHVDPNLSGWRGAVELVLFFGAALRAAQ